MRELFRRFFDDALLDRSVLGTTVEGWLLLASALALAALGVALGRALIRWRVRRTAGHETAWVERVVTDALARTRLYFLAALALYLAARIVGWDAGGEAWTASLFTVALLLQSGRWITGVIALYAERYKAEKLEADASAVTSMQALSFAARVVVWSVIGLMLLDNLGIDVTALVAGLGIGGIAIGLAVQNILSDLFASLSIVLDKPFVIGDFLAVGEEQGTVEHIGLKSTRLKSLSGEQLVFSNGDLLASRVRNYRRMTERRVVFNFGVTYGTPTATLRALPGLVKRVVEEHSGRAVGLDEGAVTEGLELPALRFDRAHFKAFGDSALGFEVVYYVLVPDYARYMDAQQAINLALADAFEARGVGFAFPTRTLHVATLPANPLPDAAADARAGARAGAHGDAGPTPAP